MKLLTYEVENRVRVGFLSKDGQWVYPISCAGLEYGNMQKLIEGMSESECDYMSHMAGKEPYDVSGAVGLSDVTLLAPIPNPKGDVICLGINYMAHAEESARYKEEAFGGERPYAVYFSKRVDRAIADGEEIPSHKDLVECLDYEAELAVIIGKDAFRVRPEEVREYIFGYTVLNDVSARDVQTKHKQWYFGKSLDGFCPMGPWIVTADEIAYPPKLKIQSWVNKELRQDSNTERMIFGIDHIISELSAGMTLKAGTVISTGTPAGVGMGFEPPRFLDEGDTVECVIEGIGSLRNRID